MRHLSILFSYLLICTSAAHGNDSELVSTTTATPVYMADGRLLVKSGTDLAPDTLLATFDEVTNQNVTYLMARSIFPDNGTIFIRSSDVVPFKDLTQSLAEKLTAGNFRQPLDPQAPNKKLQVPASIQTGGVDIRDAWTQLQPLVELNEQAPEAERLPEPYFTRAQLWARVRNYPAALKDYLLAFKYATNSSGTIDRYSKYRDDVIKAIDNFSTLPAAPIGSNPNSALSSLQHLASGIRFYRSANYRAAIRSLDNSIAINMNNPIAWYYLALAYKNQDNLNQANYYAIKATSIERSALNHKSISRSINRALASVQGPDRLWLENHRLGNPRIPMR